MRQYTSPLYVALSEQSVDTPVLDWTWFWKLFMCFTFLYSLCLESESYSHFRSPKVGKERAEQLFQHKTVAFPCWWLIQVRWGRRGGIRLWAVSVNHTVLPHRRHLSPNTKGFSPRGTLKPISSLTCNPSRSTKSSLVERYHIHFLYQRGMLHRKSKRQRTARKVGVKILLA